MRTMKKYILACLLIAFCGSALLAQNKYTKKADKRYEDFENVKAIKEYKKVIDQGHASAYVYKRLGDTYYRIGNTEQAANYYEQYLNSAEETEVEVRYFYLYAQMLKANGNDQKSNAYMKKFAQQAPNDPRAQQFKANPDYLSELKNREQEFKLSALDINSEFQDFGPTLHDGKLYFVSARNKSRKKYDWNGQPTLDIYVAEQVAGTFQNPQLVAGDVNSKRHEGRVVITKDNKTMYFTRADGKRDNGKVNLKIYRATKVNDSWEDVTKLSINDKEYSSSQVALSPDEKTLYFSSDRPGGYGQSDIYKVAINADGSFGEPVNLGSQINTPGKDNFPFVDANGVLYFSSTGHLGMGGLDVYKAEPQGNGFGAVQNMGKEINSRHDDYAYIYNPETKKGYMASNRSGKASDDALIANDNIYLVVEVKEKVIMIYAKVIDAETGRPVKNATLEVYQGEKSLTSKSVDDEGFARFDLPGGDNHYGMQAEAEGYEPAAQKVPYQPEGKINMVIEMQPIVKMIQEEEIVLQPIHFEFDKAEITKEGAFELDKLVDIMKKHPDMVIHVVAHTDHVGNAAYNQGLSERRAQSTVQYVIDQGIDASRIDGEGVGEADPVVDCTKCTPEQNAKNRRSEFIIVKK